MSTLAPALTSPPPHSGTTPPHSARTPGPAPDAASRPALTIRRARATDEAPLGFFFDTVLRRDYFLRRGQLHDMLTNRRHRVLIAELDGVLVGVAVLTRGARLVNALVHPAYRGLGIGGALVQQSGAHEVRAKLDMSSGDPRPFYAALGFRATGRSTGKPHIELMERTKQPRRGAATPENLPTEARARSRGAAIKKARSES